MKVIKGKVHELEICDGCCADIVGEVFYPTAKQIGREFVCPRCGIEWRLEEGE